MEARLETTYYPSLLSSTTITLTRQYDQKSDWNYRRRNNNLKKLQEIRSFSDNWDGYNAKPFDNRLIQKVQNLIKTLTFQPELFPTPSGAIQLEYDSKDGNHLEFLINQSDDVEVYCEIEGVDSEHNIQFSELEGEITSLYDRYIS